MKTFEIKENTEDMGDYNPYKHRNIEKPSSIVADFVLICTYVGVCCIYTVIISHSIKQLVDRYVQCAILAEKYYGLILLIPLSIVCQIKYLKWLAVFSVMANIFVFITYIICLYYIFESPLNVADKKVVGDPARFPAFISTVILAMEGIGTVMPLENTMKNPQHFLGCPSVLVVSMTVIVFLYSTLGLFGYFRYGDILTGSITLNLPVDDWPAICAKIFLALSMFFTYPLQFFVILDIFQKYTDSLIKENYKYLTFIVARIIGVCFCVGIGIALPLLEQIINLVGACFYSVLGLVIPAVVETVYRWDRLGKFKWILWKNLCIFLFGVGSLVAGCTVTIMDIVEILNKKD